MDDLVLVIGGGTMGRGIAQTAAQAGLPVILKELTPELARKALAAIRASLERAVEKGKVQPADMAAALGRIEATDRLDAAARATVVIEAVVEDLAKKKDILAHVSGLVSPRTILATNTSALRVSDLAEAVAGPDRFLGLHFFNPAPAMKLVEVVRGRQTSDAALASAVGFVERLGKTPVRVKDTPGFVVNRLLIPLINEAAAASADGVASREDVDTAMVLGAGHPMGPLALADLIGLDIVVDVLETLERELGDPKYRPCPILAQLVQAGHLGRKTGRGFFEYGAAR
jgi:3-hydroxybutyryl-CoA dehydrogenase